MTVGHISCPGCMYAGHPHLEGCTRRLRLDGNLKRGAIKVEERRPVGTVVPAPGIEDMTLLITKRGGVVSVHGAKEVPSMTLPSEWVKTDVKEVITTDVAPGTVYTALVMALRKLATGGVLFPEGIDAELGRKK
jgi:hypothetical protein